MVGNGWQNDKEGNMLAELLVAGMIMAAPYTWSGAQLTPAMGVNFDCPLYAETWYNLPMDGLVQFLYDLGWSGYHYVREDGVHMWHDDTGNYVMVGAYLPKYPRGTVVQTSLGMGKVCDTGYFYYGADQLDIATTWSI